MPEFFAALPDYTGSQLCKPCGLGQCHKDSAWHEKEGKVIFGSQVLLAVVLRSIGTTWFLFATEWLAEM